MRLNVDLTEQRQDRSMRADLQDRGYPTTDLENIFELGRRARQETERFINGHIHDSTKGWPVRSRMPWAVI
jgi:hypothetical protein